MFPPAPALKGAIRLARLSDDSRIGVVAAASYYHSSWFSYERPFYRRYPLDTLSSYRHSFRKAILETDSIGLVVEDDLNQHEVSHVYDALSNAYPPLDEQIPKEILEKGRAVVSVAGFSLLAESPRHGQFQPDGDHRPPICDPVFSRDKSALGSANMDEILHPNEIETFQGRLVIEMMLTHPAYWRKGHASTVTEWILDLAKIDKVGLGVAGLRWENSSSLK